MPSKINARLMSPTHRLLHFVAKCVVPRSHGRSQVKPFELLLVEFLATHTPIDLPSLMINHIAHLVKRKGKDLPFGMWLTRVFIELEIKLDNVPSKVVTAAHELDANICKLMGIMLESPEPAVEAEEVAPATQNEEAPPPPPARNEMPGPAGEAGISDFERYTRRTNTMIQAVRGDLIRHNRQVTILLSQILQAILNQNRPNNP